MSDWILKLILLLNALALIIDGVRIRDLKHRIEVIEKREGATK